MVSNQPMKSRRYGISVADGRFKPALCGAVVFSFFACKPETPPAAPEPNALEETPLKIDLDADGAAWLFTFAGPNGVFETTTGLDDIPEASRAVVRVVSPAGQGLARPAAGRVHIIDATRIEAGKPVKVRSVSRAVFETQSLARLAPALSTRLDQRSAGQPTTAGLAPQAAQETAKPSPAAKPSSAEVILYGTSWCGACSKARRYFVANGIPFVDKDIESDASASEELRRKADSLGVPADRIPVLDVKGRLLVGFDPVRVATLLGAQP